MDFWTTAYRRQIRSSMGIMFAAGTVFIVASFAFPPESLITISVILQIAGSSVILGGLIRTVSLKGALSKMYDGPQNHLKIKRAYTISEDGLRSEGHDGSVSFTPWRTIIEFKDGKYGFFLMISSNFGFVVPHRAFPNQEEFHRFRSLAIGHIEAEQSGTKRPEPPARLGS